MITRLLERESRHLSHTPHVAAALSKFASTALRGPVELDGELGAAPPPPAPPATPTLPEQTAHLWPPAQPGSPDLLEGERSDVPHVEPAAMSTPEQPRMGRVDLHKNKVLLLALHYYQAGARGPRPLARAMGVSVSTAKGYIDRLEAMGEI